MGSGIRTGPGTPTSPQNTECQDVYKSLQLYSPVDVVLRKIKVGDELSFEVVRNGANLSLIALYQNEKVGAVISLPLTNCIEQGYEYKGVVVSIEHGLCIIEAIRMNS